MLELQLARATVGRVISIHLLFQPHGWATFYVDDAQGTLAVASDWGSYSYRWGRGSHLAVDPPDLSRALATRFGAHYVANKLFPEHHVYDPQATERAWRDWLIQLRRDGSIGREEAREAWDEIGLLDFGGEPPLDDAHKAMGSDVWELTETSEHPWFVRLRDDLLPAFLAELRTELSKREDSPGEPPLTKALGQITAAEAREIASSWIHPIYWRDRVLAFIEQAERAPARVAEFDPIEREAIADELERRAKAYDEEGGGGALAAYALRDAARWAREAREKREEREGGSER